MDKTTTWIIRITSLVVLAAKGTGFYIFNENNKRAKKLEAESYCKNDYLYRQYISTASQAIQLERMQSKTEVRLRSSQNLPSASSLMRQASNRYDQCVEERINR